MNPFKAGLIATGAGAAFGAARSASRGDKEIPIEDRAGAGAWAGGAAGAAAFGAGFAAFKTPVLKNMVKGSASYVRGLPESYRGTYQKAYSRAYAALGDAEKASSAARFRGANAVMRFPVMMGAGAAVGAYVAGEDRRMEGAMIGAGVGAVAKAGMFAFRGGRVLNATAKSVPGGQAMMMAGLSAGIFMAGSHTEASTEADVMDPMSGDVEYMDPAEAEMYSSGVKRRMKAMNVSGDLVFGLNNRRHG